MFCCWKYVELFLTFLDLWVGIVHTHSERSSSRNCWGDSSQSPEALRCRQLPFRPTVPSGQVGEVPTMDEAMDEDGRFPSNPAEQYGN